MSKENQKYDNITPFFKLNPKKRGTSCNVNHVGYMDMTKETLEDDIVDIATSDYEIKRFGKNIEYVDTISKYDITATIMRNNIRGDLLINGDFSLLDAGILKFRIDSKALFKAPAVHWLLFVFDTAPS